MTGEKGNDNIQNAATDFLKNNDMPNIDFSGVLKDTLNIPRYDFDSIHKLLVQILL